MEGMMVSARFHSRRGRGGHASPSPHVVRRLPRPHGNHPGGCGASIWHTITPPAGGASSGPLPRALRRVPSGEEGSWNAAWDVRPARWLHGSDSAWLLFGVRNADDDDAVSSDDSVSPENDQLVLLLNNDATDDKEDGDAVPVEEEHYKVTGVLADGRCLFRAITYGAYVSSGREAPDEGAQRELADQLRHQVAQELLKRRDEMEWSVEGDFDAYVQNIQQPWTWGGEMELLMASHVLQSPISVFMIDKSSGNLLNIANYGHDYEKGTNSIKVLFHGYGHYEALEISNYH